MKMLYNALIKPILQYCCTVWGNCTVGNLQRVLRLQKRCARLILDADTYENSVKLLNKLDWLPIDDIIRIRKLCMLHKIIQGHCPAYFNKYIEHISNTHNYNTRSVSSNNITTPACKGTLALERFTQALAVCGTLLIPSLRHSPIVILKITYLNFTVVGFLFLINLRFVKPFSFISNHVICIKSSSCNFSW